MSETCTHDCSSCKSNCDHRAPQHEPPHARSHIQKGHVNEQEINVPHDLLPELLDRARNDGAAPDNGGLGVVEQQVDAHDFHAGTAGKRVDALAVTGTLLQEHF